VVVVVGRAAIPAASHEGPLNLCIYGETYTHMYMGEETLVNYEATRRI
jgi:hypothetical protein